MAPPKPNGEDWSFLNPPQVKGDIGMLGGYRIFSLIGKGAMGFVFKGLDTGLQRVVALKVMQPAIAGSPTSRDRLLREARAAAGIQCENVVTVFQVGEDRGIPFIAMEFLEGLTLEDWQNRRKKAVSLGAVCRVARDLLRGLAAAHEKGLIHRDIKPANLWVDQKSGRIKILDFGLTRSTESEESLTLDGSILGTPAYMSPEQASGKSADARSDLFSAGTVLYHLVTGSSPFQRSGVLPTLGAVANHQPLPIRSIRPEVTPELAEFIEGLIKKSPADRPTNGQAALQLWSDVEKSIRNAVSDPLPTSGSEGASSNTTVAADTEILQTPASSIFHKEPPKEGMIPHKPRYFSSKPVAIGFSLVGILVLIGMAGWMFYPKPDKIDIKEANLNNKPTPENFNDTVKDSPAPGLHSHNDFQHKRPLLDALAEGFDSVEVDVFLRGGKLLVGSYASDLKPERTLDSLYLKPLARLHKEGKLKSLWLLIDIKTNNGVAAAKEIERELLRYPELFQRVGEPATKPVKVLLSGPSPREWILAQEKPLVRIDGRGPDLGIAGKAEVIPWVSEPWSSHFSWKGIGAIPEDQKTKLTSMANKAASAGQQLRFWGVPGVPECWKAQRECGVQRIGANKLKQLVEATK